MNNDALTASRAACIPDVPKILTAADTLADLVYAYMNDDQANPHLGILVMEALAAYWELRP